MVEITLLEKKLIVAKWMGFQYRSDMPLSDRLKFWFPELGGKHLTKVLDKLDYKQNTMLSNQLDGNVINEYGSSDELCFGCYLQDENNALLIFNVIFEIIKDQ